MQSVGNPPLTDAMPTPRKPVPGGVAAVMSCPVVSHRDGSGLLSFPFQLLSVYADPGPSTGTPLMAVASSLMPGDAVLLNPCWPSAPMLSQCVTAPGAG